MPAPLRVVVIEDSDDDTLLLLRELRRGGYDLTWERVENAAALQDALTTSAWDVVISDYSLPQFDALAALEIVTGGGYDLPFIIISGTIDETKAVSALKAGAHDFLTKGHLSRLLPALERELREARERSARRQAERALLESEARYRHLVETSPDAIVLTDMHGTIMLSNQQAQRLYADEQATALTGVSAASLIDPTDYARAAQTYRQLLADGSVHNQEFNLLRANGRSFPAEISVSVVADAEGRPTNLVSVVRDVTARKALESQFLQAQKMEAVGRLAGGIAHDFNNLLTVIAGYAEVLLEDLDDELAHRDDIEQIRDAAERATMLTRQLLAFTRRQSVAVQALDLNQLVRGMERLLHRLIGPDIELQSNLAPTACVVRADAGQLEQVILNLAINARDAMPEGGRLTIETAQVDLGESFVEQNRAFAAGRYVLLTVSDTGHGMDRETQSHIFEPFFTTKAPEKGTGLGLSTVYGIVRQSGGMIWVYSEPDQGATFRIYIPRVSEAAEVPSLGERSTSVAQRPATIVVAEHDLAVRALIRRILERQNHTLLEADQHSAALNLVQDSSEPIDLLITDIALPGGSGVALAERARELRPDLRILYMSGHAEHPALGRRVPGDPVALLQKPFSPEALLQAVAKELGAGHG
jgi:two-component system cell cycle sensor histidine kinase/response regulator CckA